MNNENAARIEKIFNDMMEFPLHLLDFYNFSGYFERIDVVKLKEREYVSVGDALFLLDYLPGSQYYQEMYPFYCRSDREDIRNELLRELFYVMQASMDKSDVVKSFMDLTIDEFFYHISDDAERSEEQIAADIGRYKEKTLCCSEYRLNRNSPLADYANEISRITNDLSNASEEQMKAIPVCKEDVYCFLIKYVKEKYHDMFDVSKQCE